MKDISQADMGNNLPLVTRRDIRREVRAGNVSIGVHIRQRLPSSDVKKRYAELQ